MKLVLAVVAIATLGGCAVYPAAPPMYGVRAAPAGSYDPYQWHTVGPAQGASSQPVEYASQPAQGYAAQPVYAQPVYAQPLYPQPLYAQPVYPYFPPVTIGLDFMFGGWCCGHRGGWGRGGYRGRR